MRLSPPSALLRRNPWGPGATTLEWTVPSPAPFHTFETPPHIFGDEDAHAPAIAGRGSMA